VVTDRIPADARTIAIFCAKCRTLLYRYRKGGSGGLVKVRPGRIAEDHTDGKLTCPGCGQQFARGATIGGGPAYKIIGGKVFTKGMRRK
jgi:hypothetical protein